MSQQSFVVGFLGRLAERKGWQDFLHVANRVMALDPTMLFVVAGDGEDRERVLSATKEAPNSRYIGRVDDVGSFLAAIDCLVIPSHFEPMGLVQLEAQYVGVPVVAYDIPGLNETLIHGENALLALPRQPGELANLVLRLSSDSVLQEKLRRSGYDNVKKYTFDSYVERLEQIYWNCVPGRSC